MFLDRCSSLVDSVAYLLAALPVVVWQSGESWILGHNSKRPHQRVVTTRIRTLDLRTPNRFRSDFRCGDDRNPTHKTLSLVSSCVSRCVGVVCLGYIRVS